MLASFEDFTKLKRLCGNIIEKPNDFNNVREIKSLIENVSPNFMSTIQTPILSSFYPILKNIAEGTNKFSEDEKRILVDTLRLIFEKSTIKSKGIFFNIYSLLLFEIYDHYKHKVLDIHEEYKLAIMQCVSALSRSLSHDLILEIYTKENAPKLSQMLYVAVELSQKEQFRNLRIAAMECIMSLAQVYKDEDFADVCTRNHVANLFLFFLPGIASGLKNVALEDEKVGHKIPKTAIKAWGRIITLLMQDYNACDNKINLSDIQIGFQEQKGQISKKPNSSKKNVKDYIEETVRTPEWYKKNDENLKIIVTQLKQLTYHSHQMVRYELAIMASIIVENCLTTMPSCIAHLIEILITLSEDVDANVSSISKSALEALTTKLSIVEYKILLENLEDGFYNVMNSLPRIFNGIDEKEQLATLNLLIGYLNIFGDNKLQEVLISCVHLNKLMSSLLHICELEKTDVRLLEEYSSLDFELKTYRPTPWKKFRHFENINIQFALKKICKLITEYGGLRVTIDYLLDCYLYNIEHKKEATLLINKLISGIKSPQEHMPTLKTILNTYTMEKNWNLPVRIMIDEFGYECTLADVQNNVIQICLQLEGIGVIANVLTNTYKNFMLNTLFLILTKAGSGHPLIHTAGLICLTEITKACCYKNVTHLISDNIDYFSFHVNRKLNRADDKTAFDVLNVVLENTSVEVLPYISDIINEALIQSCDKFKEVKATDYLELFRNFIKNLRRWFNITAEIDPFKTKVQKENEEKEFQVTGINYEDSNNFTDDIMAKSAEESYKEDMEKKEKDLENEISSQGEDEYKKPEPPMEVTLTVSILKVSLHFLPSKERNRRLLVLEILRDGLEIIRDWDDELLPIVHQVWSPLIERFKAFNEPLIINYSFQLLIVLARLSKDFIRSRIAKDVLPNINKTLNNLSQESFLKDKGSSYRYSQSYKLQLVMLENLGSVLMDADILEKDVHLSMEAVYPYLSDKQPVPLQNLAIKFFKTLILYDPVLEEKLKSLSSAKNMRDCDKNVDKIFN